MSDSLTQTLDTPTPYERSPSTLRSIAQDGILTDNTSPVVEWAANEIDRLRAAVALAYGHLWHVNNEPASGLRSPEACAYEARKALRDLLTHEQRGEAINTVGRLIGRYTGDVS